MPFVRPAVTLLTLRYSSRSKFSYVEFVYFTPENWGTRNAILGLGLPRKERSRLEAIVPFDERFVKEYNFLNKIVSQRVAIILAMSGEAALVRPRMLSDTKSMAPIS